LPRGTIRVKVTLGSSDNVMSCLEIHDCGHVTRTDLEVLVEALGLFEAFFHPDEDDRGIAASKPDELFDTLPVDHGKLLMLRMLIRQSRLSR
jgi:hypothetical protein